MRHKKTLATLILVIGLVMSLIPAQAVATRDFPEVLAEAKQGVVQIYGLSGYGYLLESWIGSGFAVGEKNKETNVFLTNWHVVTASGKFDVEKVRLWILQENCQIDEKSGEPDPSKSIECEVLKTTTGYPDYAIIRATEPVSGYRPLPLLSSKEIQDGATVYALGFPGIVGDMSASHYGINDITSTDGIISQHLQMVDADNTWVLMHTAKISGGNSGGPLITKDGAVVGMNTYVFGETEITADRFCAVYIDYAIDGLDSLNLSYELYQDESTMSEDPSQAEYPPQTDETTPVAKPAEGSNDYVWIYCVVGAVAVVVLLLQIVLRQKKKNGGGTGGSSENAGEREKQPENNQTILLRTSGGHEVTIHGSSGTIGRDPGCAIVLPENAPGVSRIHCRLEIQEDRLILTDLNSTYGTYIHQKRIPANTPVILNVGSSFCLGSEKYALTVIKYNYQ